MLRSKAIAQNIANIDVPGYKRVEVTFESDLQRALDKSKLRGTKTSDKHLDIGRKSISKVHPDSYRPQDLTNSSGVNNVDIDIENAKLAENQILFNYEVKLGGERFKAVQQAIKGRN